MKHFIVIACVALSACTTFSKSPPSVTITGCGQFENLSPEFQRRLADALEAAPPEIIIMSQEWASLREQAKRCQQRR